PAVGLEISAHRSAISRLESAARSPISSSCLRITYGRSASRGGSAMRVFLVNPSHVSFGTAVITPRWLYVLGGATPPFRGTPIVCDETLEPFDAGQLVPGDVVGIGIHTGNALRGYEVGRIARARGASVVFGGIHATLFPTEAHALGGAHAVVRGDGDII